MPPTDRFTHGCEEFLPDELDEGVLYVSLRYSIVVHLCACGCRTKVFCALDPSDYKITFDGQSISMWPSIGNWDFHCRSHYIIRRGQVQWVPAISYAAVTAGSRSDKKAKDARVKRFDFAAAQVLAMPEATQFRSERTNSFWRRIVEKICRSSPDRFAAGRTSDH